MQAALKSLRKPVVGLFLTWGCLSFLGACSTEPYADMSPNGIGYPLERGDMPVSASREIKDKLTDYIRKETYYDAVTMIYQGKVVYEYGDVNHLMNLASARKSVFSMLYGIAQAKGLVDIDRTLESYGVDDSKQPLTSQEKQATLRQLLQARSGIYVKALGESSGMVARKPERGSFAPGEHYYYNNFDFNVLPIVLENLTGMSIGEMIYQWLAVPLGMTYFKPGDVTYEYADITDFPQTRVYMSCEDLARLGLLMVQDGVWNGEEIIPQAWVKESSTAVSKAPEDADLNDYICQGYAYLWWVDLEAETFWANGAYGQSLIVDPARDLVIALRNNSGSSVSGMIENMIKNEYEGEESAKAFYELSVEELGL